LENRKQRPNHILKRGLLKISSILSGTRNTI